MTESNESSIRTFFKTFSGSSSSDKDSKEFNERLRTFIVGQKWVRRPLVLSPAKCAKYGWKCLNYNLLECVTCGAKICSPEPNINIPDVYKACIEKVLKELRSSHKTHCPWPLTPSPESFVRMMVLPKEEALKLFLQRFKECQVLSSFLPQVKDSAIEKLGLKEEHIESLCKICEVSAEDSQKFGSSAVCLAALGWTLVSNSNDNQKTCIECQNCQRSVWSGSFSLIQPSKSESIDEPSQNGNGIKSEKSQCFKRFKKDYFDPLEEHRPWCLWIVSESQGSFGDSKNSNPNYDIPGWRIFMKSLLKNINIQENEESDVNPSKEHIRSVRDLLDTWTDPIE